MCFCVRDAVATRGQYLALSKASLMISCVLSVHAEIREYCNIEKFNASCVDSGAGSLIVMDYAYYGRQRVGRCVRDLGRAGKCGVDVLAVTDSRCSGRRTCTIRLPDDQMYAMNACRESVSHLYAAYSCVTGNER